MTITWQVEQASEPSHAPAITSSKKFNARTDVSIMIHDKGNTVHVARMKEFAGKNDPVVVYIDEMIFVCSIKHKPYIKKQICINKTISLGTKEFNGDIKSSYLQVQCRFHEQLLA